MKRFSIGLIILGLVILFGTAGASDIGSIALSQIWMQAIASVLFLFTGMLGLKVCHMEKVRTHRVHQAQKRYSHSSALRTYVLKSGRKMKKIA